MCRLPLSAKKEKILRNLSVLEKAGMVESDDHFQIMVNAIAQVCTIYQSHITGRNTIKL